MPIYEYQCTACNHQFDALQKMSDAVLTDCPACHKAALQKIMSTTSFQLKGTGWYETDFKSKPQTETQTSTKTETKASNDTSAPASTTINETKPAAAQADATKTDK